MRAILAASIRVMNQLRGRALGYHSTKQRLRNQGGFHMPGHGIADQLPIEDVVDAGRYSQPSTVSI